jgi:hypothetical protein
MRLNFTRRSKYYCVDLQFIPLFNNFNQYQPNHHNATMMNVALLVTVFAACLLSVQSADCPTGKRCAGPSFKCLNELVINADSSPSAFSIELKPDESIICRTEGSAEDALRYSGGRPRIFCKGRDAKHQLEITITDEDRTCVDWKITNVAFTATNIFGYTIEIDNGDIGSPSPRSGNEYTWLTNVSMAVNEPGRVVKITLMARSTLVCIFNVQLTACCQKLATTATTSTTTPTTTTPYEQDEECPVRMNVTVTDDELTDEFGGLCSFDKTPPPRKSECVTNAACQANKEQGKFQITDDQHPLDSSVDSVCQCCKTSEGHWEHHPITCWFGNQPKERFFTVYQIDKCRCQPCGYGSAAPGLL